MESSSDTNHSPSWLDESTPLMGSGSNPFADDSDDADDDDEISPLQSIGEGAAERSKSSKDEPKTTPSPSADDWRTEPSASSPKKSSGKKKTGNKNKDGFKVPFMRRPAKNCCLELFHWFGFLAVITLLCLLAAQLFPLIFIPLDQLGFVQTMIRIYLSLFTIILIMVELHAPIPFFQKSSLLQAFLPRGFIYTFLAVMEMEEAYSKSESTAEELVNHAFISFKIQWAPIFMQVTAWVVFGVGCIYILFGICCLQVLRDRLEKQYKEKMEEYDHAEVV